MKNLRSLPRVWRRAFIAIGLICAAMDLPLRASPILVGPIELSGTGTFTYSNPYHDSQDSGTAWNIALLSGTSGFDSLSAVSISPTKPGLPNTLSVLSGFLFPTGQLIIDGIRTGCFSTCYTGYFDFRAVAPGEWGGLATIYDQDGNAVISASLAGNVIVTSETDVSFNPDGSLGLGFGTFEIVHAPEPAAYSFIALGLAVLLLKGSRRKSLNSE